MLEDLLDYVRYISAAKFHDPYLVISLTYYLEGDKWYALLLTKGVEEICATSSNPIQAVRELIEEIKNYVQV